MLNPELFVVPHKLPYKPRFTHSVQFIIHFLPTLLFFPLITQHTRQKASLSWLVFDVSLACPSPKSDPRRTTCGFILITRMIVCFTIVCNEWTELNCSGEAAPEELEEHSMVAYEVKTPFLMWLTLFLTVSRMCFHSLDLFRAFSMCLGACWTLRTPSGDIPSGCLTSVSFPVDV